MTDGEGRTGREERRVGVKSEGAVGGGRSEQRWREGGGRDGKRREAGREGGKEGGGNGERNLGRREGWGVEGRDEGRVGGKFE